MVIRRSRRVPECPHHGDARQSRSGQRQVKTKREAPAKQREHGVPRNKPRNKQKAPPAEVAAETVEEWGKKKKKKKQDSDLLRDAMAAYFYHSTPEITKAPHLD